MRMTSAISDYLADMRSEGRLTTVESERAYHSVLHAHAADVNNRDPRTTGRDDVKVTLKRWPNPNTQAQRRAILISFYRWTVQEGLRPYNPAEQTRAPKKTKTSVYRLTADECRRMLFASLPDLYERRAIHLGICAGPRRTELRQLQGRHFARPGFVWISPDIGKGGKERWVPVIADLAPVVDEIRDTVTVDEYVLPGQAAGIAGTDATPFSRVYPDRAMGVTTLYNLVGEVGKRAGIAADIHPHLLRHAFCDHIARLYGLEVAQALMGHADPATTRGYTGEITLDDLTSIVSETTFATPEGATPLRDAAKTQQYRQRDSNPRFQHAEPVSHDGGNPDSSEVPK